MPIDNLLSEIEKFKTNISNSNDLINLLHETSKKLSEQGKVLDENHNKVIAQLNESIDGLNNSLTQNNDFFNIELGRFKDQYTSLDEKIINLRAELNKNNKKSVILFSIIIVGITLLLILLITLITLSI